MPLGKAYSLTMRPRAVRFSERDKVPKSSMIEWKKKKI